MIFHCPLERPPCHHPGLLESVGYAENVSLEPPKRSFSLVPLVIRTHKGPGSWILIPENPFFFFMPLLAPQRGLFTLGPPSFNSLEHILPEFGPNPACRAKITMVREVKLSGLEKPFVWAQPFGSLSNGDRRIYLTIFRRLIRMFYRTQPQMNV